MPDVLTAEAVPIRTWDSRGPIFGLAQVLLGQHPGRTYRAGFTVDPDVAHWLKVPAVQSLPPSDTPYPPKGFDPFDSQDQMDRCGNMQ